MIPDSNNENENEVAVWLKEVVGLPQYIPIFASDGYDDLFTIKETLTEDDLKEMGITMRGHRKKIMVLVKKLRQEKNLIKKDFLDS